MVHLQVHKCRFVSWMPQSISTLKYSHSQTKLAVGRANGAIEVWNTENRWYQQLNIPGTGPNNIARSFVWVPTKLPIVKNVPSQAPERLFSAGLNGEIIEWDLVRLQPKFVTIVGAGGIWAMDGVQCKSKDSNEVEYHYLLSIACEDGRVRVYRVTDDGPCILQSTSLRQQTRILSVSFHENGKLLCCGDAAGAIQILQTNNCKQKYRMTSSAGKGETCRVWAVIFLRNGTIISGNSAGHTEFWDSAMGVQIQSIRSHDYDIISLVANARQETIISAGVENKLVKIAYSGSRWVVVRSRRHHTHDVAAVDICMTSTGKNRCEWVVSGGVDSLLISQTLEKMEAEIRFSSTTRVFPFPHLPQYSISRAKRLLLCFTSNALQLWQLGQARDEDISFFPNHGAVPMASAANQILDIDLKSTWGILCCAMSPDSQYIAASTIRELYLFSLVLERGAPQLRRIRLPAVSGVLRMVFSGDSARLFLATNEGLIVVFDIASRQVIQVFSEHQGNQGSICTLAISDDAQWLASGDTTNTIHIFNLDLLKHWATTPKFPVAHSAIAFAPLEPVLTVVCSNSQIYQYDFDIGDLTDWSQKHSTSLPGFFLYQKEVIKSISYNPGKPSMLVLVASTNFFVVNFAKPVPTVVAHKAKSVKRERDGTDKAVITRKTSENFQAVNYKPILFAGFLDANELVVVQRPWSHVTKDLPTPVFRHKYGKG